MSESCEASTPFVLHSAAMPVSDFFVHTPAVRTDERDETEAIDGAMPPASVCAQYFAVKSIVDKVITAMLMVVALPIMLLVGLAIILVDGRPIFYRQTRVGKDGRVFRIWKFRTMCRDAESATGVVWSSEADPRVTMLGRWLRCAHLDELPQFFNVLAGDMNLIGPRPERPEFVRELAVELPRYRERLLVRPGITGLAQLRFGYDQSLADVRRKALLDYRYIRTTSFFLDVRILLMTVPYIADQVVAKLVSSPKLDQADSFGVVGSPASGVTSPVRRLKPAVAHEFKPQFALLPDTSVGFRSSRLGAKSTPHSFSMDGVVQATDDCH